MITPVKETISHQQSRSDQIRTILGTVATNVHGVFDTPPKGMEVGDVQSIRDGRTFVLCKNIGAAAILAGQSASAGMSSYDIDGANEIIIPTADRNIIEFYLGGSGTTTTKAAMIGAMIGVVTGTGLGLSRRIVGFESFTHIISGTSYTAYRVRIDNPLNIDLDSTSVLKVVGIIAEVTLYDAEAQNGGLVILGGSASDSSVAQNKYFFVLTSGFGITRIQGSASAAGDAVRGSVTAGDDGSMEIVSATDLVAPSGIAPFIIADNAYGFILRLPSFPAVI